MEACRASHDAARLAAELRGKSDAAVRGPWAEPLRERADAATLRAAELLLEAHTRCERAEGAARAIGFARRREAWRAHDPREIGEWLIAAGERR